MASGTVGELQVRAAGSEGSGCQLCELGMELLLELSQSRIGEAIDRFALPVMLRSAEYLGYFGQYVAGTQGFVLRCIQLDYVSRTFNC